MRTPASVLADLLSSDPARPRVTFYEDTPGPRQGERIELSGRVLGNWVSKAGNALQEEYDVAPGSVVRLALPASHWRTLYWALAVWSVGAAVATTDVHADLLVADDPAAADGTDLVVVSLAALARSHPGPLPAGAMDEARELATYDDRLAAWATPAPSDPALITAAGTRTYETVVPASDWPSGSRVCVAGDVDTVLESALAAWSVDGSVVIVHGADAARMPARLEAEGVTLRVG